MSIKHTIPILLVYWYIQHFILEFSQWCHTQILVEFCNKLKIMLKIDIANILMRIFSEDEYAKSSF